MKCRYSLIQNVSNRGKKIQNVQKIHIPKYIQIILKDA